MKRYAGRGGSRLGSGRPPLPEATRRHNRVVVMMNDAEHDKLKRLAASRGLPVGTLAYEFFAGALRRARAGAPTNKDEIR